MTMTTPGMMTIMMTIMMTTKIMKIMIATPIQQMKLILISG